MTQALQQPAEAAQGAGPELSLTGDFEGVALKKSETGGLTVDVSALNGVDLTIITSGGVLQFKAAAPAIELRTPAPEQASAPGVIASSPTAGAFNPANAVIKVGLVQLNKISQYLTDLPDTAKAEFLVSPKSTATIFGRGLGVWNEDTASVRGIDASHGIHFDGQALAGMQIFDRPRNAPGVTYEEALAKEIRAAWDKVNATGEAVTTGLAIGTKELVHGRKIGSSDVTVGNNLYSRVDDVNAAIAKQGGEKILTKSGSVNARWQFTATELPGHRAHVYSVDFTDGDHGWGHKDGVHSSSRPVALRLLAPNP